MTSTAAQHPNGLHHVAFMAGDMKKQLEFFTQVLGFPLVAIFEMHGIEGASHAFLRMNDQSLFSLVHIPGTEAIETTFGVTHSGRGEIPCAPGALQHSAFGVPDEAALLAMRDRVRSHGIPIIGPIDHGFCKSLYFAGPENMTLEIATSTRDLEPTTWVDRAMLADLGFSEEDTKAMIAPAPYTGPAGVPQPEYDAAKPRLNYPEEQFRAMLATPDSVFEQMPAFEPPAQAA